MKTLGSVKDVQSDVISGVRFGLKYFNDGDGIPCAML